MDNSFEILDILQKNPLKTSLNCSAFTLTTWELGFVARALLHFPSITSLTLGPCKMDNDAVEMLLKNSSITSLAMDAPLEDMDTTTLDAYTRLIRETRFITSFDSLFPNLFDLEEEILESEGIQSLIEAIKVNKSIASLEFKHCTIYEDSYELIAEIIQENKFITTFMLNNVTINRRCREMFWVITEQWSRKFCTPTPPGSE